MSGAMSPIPGLLMCREMFWRLGQPSAACTIQVEVLWLHRVQKGADKDEEAQAVSGKAAQPPWMDLGGQWGLFLHPSVGLVCLWPGDMVSVTFSAASRFGKPQLLLKHLSP